jgi:hypothetical protein
MLHQTVSKPTPLQAVSTLSDARTTRRRNFYPGRVNAIDLAAAMKGGKIVEVENEPCLGGQRTIQSMTWRRR